MLHKFRPKPICLAVALAATASGVAVAQDQVLEEVVVSGIRGSLMRAQAV
ncbi:hypothetical protein G8764_08600 [Pseudomaricurvus alcaniphilus]|nr:hypothetical protein [Pseudomaricurvus alcaniphilus]NHN37346.1 hypothetical protein [Pseudomaricurvus alcaniphilus]